MGPQNDSQSIPRLETLTLEFGDAIELTDSLRVEYGVLFESVKFVNRLHFASPYGKAVYELAPGRELAFSYASGVPPTFASHAGRDAALRNNVRQLGMFPARGYGPRAADCSAFGACGGCVSGALRQ